MGPEMTKLAAKLHAPCPYCGRRHAGKHNNATTQAPEKTALEASDVVVPALSSVSPLFGGAAAGLTAPEGEGWRRTGYTLGGTMLGHMAGGAAGSLLSGLHPLAPVITTLLGGAAGGHLGFEASKKPRTEKAAFEWTRNGLPTVAGATALTAAAAIPLMTADAKKKTRNKQAVELPPALLTSLKKALPGIGVGAATGALGGAFAGDDEHRLRNILLGGAAGAVGGGAISHIADQVGESVWPGTTRDWYRAWSGKGAPAKTAMEALRDKLAQRMSLMQQHAVSDAWRAQAQAPVSTQMSMRMSPQDALARQQMLQNPQMFAGGGGPSGLELARPMMKRSSEIEKLRQKLAFAPLIAGGLMAARAALPAIGRAVFGAGAKAMASPVGKMVGQQAVGTGVMMGAQRLTQPKPQGPLPGQIGGV